MKRRHRSGLAHRFAIGLIPLVLAFSGPIARAGDLDPLQVKTLATLVGHAKEIETNVKLAADGVGSGEGKPSDAKIRLARTRLVQPKATLAAVREALDTLPKDNVDVAALRKRIDESAAAITALEDRLDGKSPGGPGAPARNPPATPTIKLDYKQQKALSDGDFHVRRVEGIAQALVELRKKIDGIAERDAIDHRLVRDGMNSIQFARMTAVAAKTHLDPLPPDGEGVAAVATLLASSMASVADSEAAIAPIHRRLSALVDPRTYPTLGADVTQLRELAGMYRDADVLTRDPRRAALLVAEAPAAKTAYEGLRKAYAAFVAQATEEGKPIDGALRHFRETFAAFELAVDQRSETLSGAIGEAVAKVNELADQAVAERKPAFFVHAIPDRVRAIDDMVALAMALDAEGGKTASTSVAALRAGLRTKQTSLLDAIVDANELPPDRYVGSDRAELEKAAAAALKTAVKAFLEARKESEPFDMKVLSTRIPNATWRRETLWRHQNSSWYLIDRSALQVQLIVEGDSKAAFIIPVDLWIDHRNGDERKAILLYDLGAPFEPWQLLHRDRVK